MLLLRFFLISSLFSRHLSRAGNLTYYILLIILERFMALMCGPDLAGISGDRTRSRRGWPKFPLRLLYYHFVVPLAGKCVAYNPSTLFTVDNLVFWIIHEFLGPNREDGSRTILWDLQPKALYSNMHEALVVTLVKKWESNGCVSIENGYTPVPRGGRKHYEIPKNGHSLWPYLPATNAKQKWLHPLTTNIKKANEYFCHVVGFCLVQTSWRQFIDNGTDAFIFAFEEKNLAWVCQNTYCGVPLTFFFQGKGELLAYFKKLTNWLCLKQIRDYTPDADPPDGTVAPKEYFNGVDLRSEAAIQEYLAVVGVAPRHRKKCAERWFNILASTSRQWWDWMIERQDDQDQDAPLGPGEADWNRALSEQHLLHAQAIFAHTRDKLTPLTVDMVIIEMAFGMSSPLIFAQMIRLRCVGIIASHTGPPTVPILEPNIKAVLISIVVETTHIQLAQYSEQRNMTLRDNLLKGVDFFRQGIVHQPGSDRDPEEELESDDIDNEEVPETNGQLDESAESGNAPSEKSEKKRKVRHEDLAELWEDSSENSNSSGSEEIEPSPPETSCETQYHSLVSELNKAAAAAILLARADPTTRKKKIPFTLVEDLAILDGEGKYEAGSNRRWVNIQILHWKNAFSLNKRSNVQIKDRSRSMKEMKSMKILTKADARKYHRRNSL
jgi:hypothetical protein